MHLPPEVAAFLAQAIEVGTMCLPDHYPHPAKFSEFQAGYRYDANSGELLTGEQAGDFKTSWYVVAANYFDDPFYVDFLEQEAGFPVYFSYHGAGSWTPLKVSASLSEFAALLAALQEDTAAAVALVRRLPEATNEFWQEVLAEYETSGEE